MSREEFDVAVIGGGITGAGIALDAGARGLKVALIERRDFSSGTSSRSSKLIHGGLRYLERLQFGLVRESLQERATLQRIAPHLARTLAFVVPIYEPPRRSPLGDSKLKLAAGLTLYDLLAGRRGLGKHFWLEGKQASAFASGLDTRGLRGCFVYYDALTDDSRLVVEVIKTASAHGAVIANYAGARELIRVGGRIAAVVVEDSVARRTHEVRARLVINATGVWSDQVARLAGEGATRTLRPSKGVHVVVPAEKVRCTSAVLIPSLGENRFLFVIPWHGRTLIGTSDSDYDGDLDDPVANREEIQQIVSSCADYFPESNLTTADVISSFAGLRPLVGGAGSSTKDLSRKEHITETSSGLISVIGGKLTTYRRIAERVTDIAQAKLGRGDSIRASTDRIILAGGSVPEWAAKDKAEGRASQYGVTAETVEHLMRTYGGNHDAILEITRESELLKRHLVQGAPNIEAEAVYAGRYEMVATADDFLSRRTRIALLDAGHGTSFTARVAELIRL